ncbi:MAG: 4a-hydroxytetrahydrobiopterin dehydratase [Dehalococcoidia bacterium]|nr:MAG: 4a-hydroxytetrahydrobiopterin dehydratase [Dehalococcoidia bacterium]
MAGELATARCEACGPGSPQVTPDEQRRFAAEIPEWQVFEEDGERRLRRVFTFPDFARALAFTDRIGAIAEQEGHHPALLTEWGKVAVTWWTHSIGGLHKNDFIMAAKTDAVWKQEPARTPA